jgi:hypothetical protein
MLIVFLLILSPNSPIGLQEFFTAQQTDMLHFPTGFLKNYR